MVGSIAVRLQTRVDISSLVLVEEFGLRWPVRNVPVACCCEDDCEQSLNNEDPPMLCQRARGNQYGLHLPPTTVATNTAHETNAISKDTTKSSS